jgi:hypothetical protein
MLSLKLNFYMIIVDTTTYLYYYIIPMKSGPLVRRYILHHWIEIRRTDCSCTMSPDLNFLFALLRFRPYLFQLIDYIIWIVVEII